MKFAIDRRVDMEGQPTQFYITTTDSNGKTCRIAFFEMLDDCETPAQAAVLLSELAIKIALGWEKHEAEAKRSRDVAVAAGEAGTA